MSRFSPASALVYALAIVLGIVAFLYPFAREALPSSAGSPDSPLFLSLLLGICLLALILDAQANVANTKVVALLGILVAINSSLRFVETAIPGPAGFSPIFFLIALSGYVYGGRFGFLMGVFTLLVSGLITGGIGPWLPYQMFAAGLVGLSAPICRPLVGILGNQGGRIEVTILAAYASTWGLLYGAIMSLSFWPFIAGSGPMSWRAGAGLGEALGLFTAYYLATSLVWDIARVAGNLILTLALGSATLRVLRRFRRRFTFQHTSSPDQARVGAEP